MPVGPVTASESEKWEALERSIRKGARILGKEPPKLEPFDWKLASGINKDIWDQVYGRKIVKSGNPGKNVCCPAGLVELKNALARELEDEITASSRYREAAIKFTHYKYPDFAKTLGAISEEEFNHWINLVTIVEALNKVCECDEKS